MLGQQKAAQGSLVIGLVFQNSVFGSETTIDVMLADD